MPMSSFVQGAMRMARAARRLSWTSDQPSWLEQMFVFSLVWSWGACSKGGKRGW